MKVERTTEPSAEPVSLDEAKAHLRIVDYADDDDYVSDIIAAARRAIEDATGRTLIDTEFTQHVRGWCPWIDLIRGQAHTAEAITYDADDGTEQTVDPALYELRAYGDGRAEVVFSDDFEEPNLRDMPRVDRVRIRFTAGYGDAPGSVPEPLRRAALFWVAHLYEDRTPVGVNVNLTRMPFAIESLIAPYVLYLT